MTDRRVSRRSFCFPLLSLSIIQPSFSIICSFAHDRMKREDEYYRCPVMYEEHGSIRGHLVFQQVVISIISLHFSPAFTFDITMRLYAFTFSPIATSQSLYACSAWQVAGLHSQKPPVNSKVSIALSLRAMNLSLLVAAFPALLLVTGRFA